MRSSMIMTIRWILVLSAIAVLLFPVYWMVKSSITPARDILSNKPTVLPTGFTTEHYENVLSGESHFPRALLNSLKVSGIVTVLAIPLSFGGGYAISRFRFRGRSLFGFTLLGTQMLPGVMLAIPLYATISSLGLIDTHFSLIICYTTFTIPFSTWMLRGFFDGFPVSIEESAHIDGCSRFGILWRIVLPISGPGVVATAILAFLLAWNEYMFAMMFITTDELKTFPLALKMFMAQFNMDYGSMMAASVIVSLPVAILFLGLQKWLVTGLTAGSVKG